MPAFFVSFGQAHVHRVNGQTLDADVLAEIQAVDATAARERAFALFGRKWAFIYDGTEMAQGDVLRFFPRAIISLDKE